MQKKAIILLSGGLDSTTCLALAKQQGFSCYGLSFVYGQKHSVELEAAKRVAKNHGVIEHKILSLPLDEIRGSSLIDKEQEIPDYQGGSDIPSTYVPARNTIMLSFALAWGEVISAYDIFLGANYLDYSGYPDCRPEYLQAFERMAVLATKVSVQDNRQFKIHAPLLQMDKAEIIRTGTALGVCYAETISCYRANTKGEACGRCDSCTYRKKGFQEANIKDTTVYHV